MDVDGKAAIITGGGTGVGRATGLALAKRGCSVLVNYSRSKDDAERTAEEIRALGVKAMPFRADVADDTDARAMVDAAVKELGSLSVLVNNAGTTVFVDHADLEGVRSEDWDRLMSVNVKGAFQVSRAAKGPIEASGGGDIVNTSSVAGLRAVGSSIPYAASKAALNNMTVALARVFAPSIRVNAVAPGFITGRWLATGLGNQYEPYKARNERKAVLGKVCDPEDVADAILSLITGSDLVTGHVLPVEGGLLIAP